MASSDKDLKIGIKVSADTAGAKQAEAAVRDVGVAAEKLGQTTTEAGAAASEAIETLGKSAADTTAAVEATAAATETVAEKTTAAKDSVEEVAKQFAEANARSAEWGNTLEKLNNEQLLELEERLRADIKAQQELGESTDALKRKLEDVYSRRTTGLEQTFANAARTGKDAAAAVGKVGTEIRNMQGAAGGARGVLQGLSRGGFTGLAQAAQGAAQVIRSFAAGAMGTVLLPVLALGAGALLLMRKRTDELQAATRKMYEEAAASKERIKAAYEQIAEAAEKSATAQIASIAKLTASYDEYLQRLERTDERLKESIKLQTELKAAELDRDEQRALAAAETPAQREKITADFAGRRSALSTDVANAEIITEINNALLIIRQMADEDVKLQADRDVMERELAQARKELEDARSLGLGEQREKGVADRETLERWRKAQDAADEAEANAPRVRENLARQQAAVTETSNAARAQLEAARLRGSRRIVELETDLLKRSAEAKATRSGLVADARTALDNQDVAGQDKAVREIRALDTALAAATAENTRAILALTAALSKETLSAPPQNPAASAAPVTVRPGGQNAGQPRGGTIQRPGDSQPVPIDEALKASREKETAFVRFVASTGERDAATAGALNAAAGAIESGAKKVDKVARQLANSR